MLLQWRANLADQNKQQPQKINMSVTYHTKPLSMKQTFNRLMSILFASRANQALRSLANVGFQNRGVCQAFPSFFLPPSPAPLSFLALVSFLAWPKPKIPFLGLSLLRNQTETLATQARRFIETPFQWRRFICGTD